MKKADALIEPLTRREQEILPLLAKQCTNQEIASTLTLSVNSVKWYARQIYGKLGIENRRQVASRAVELGLLSPVPGPENISYRSVDSDNLFFTPQPSKPKHNLPIQLTTFVGREAQIEQLKGLLNTSRLVTLTGTGGVGKTRLALALVTQLTDLFKDGVWLVELAPLGDPEHIPGAIASIFSLRADQNRSLHTALLDYLREKQLLLILDNCEHLIEACAELCDALLRTCPQVCILATSREALNIEGEIPFYVPSLSIPDPTRLPGIDSLTGYESIQLFLERARLVLPGFTINETNISSLVQVCRRLDGIPLALELAAARLQVLSLDQIAARLDDRFRLLTGGSRRVLPRHQTLQALIDWSYELLSDAERTLFRRLSIFAARWSLEAVEAIYAGESSELAPQLKTSPERVSSTELLDLLGEMVKKSLITVEREGDLIRGYRMLETIRQYAQEKLLESGEAEVWRDRHLDYFLTLGEQSEPVLRGPGILERLELLDSQVDNIRLALSWALSGGSPHRVAQGLQLASSLGFYWYARSLLDEGIKWLKNGLDVIPIEAGFMVQLRAKVLFTISFLTLYTLDFTRISEVKPLLEHSQVLFNECNDRLGAALVQCMLGCCLMSKYITSYADSPTRPEYPQAHSLVEQGLAVCRELAEPPDLAFALLMNQLIDSLGLRLEKAKASGQEALALCEKNGDKMIMGLILMRLGSLALTQGDLAGSELYMHKGLQLGHELNDRMGIMQVYTGLGSIDYFNQDFKRMETDFLTSLELSKETGELIYTMFSLRNLGIAALRQGDLNRSSEFYLENLALAQKIDWVENEWAKYDGITFILGMAGISQALGSVAQSARLLGAVEAHIQGFFKPLDTWDQSEFDRISHETRQQSEPSDFTAAWSAGSQLTFEQAIAEAQLVAL